MEKDTPEIEELDVRQIHKDTTENTPLDELTAITDAALTNKINEIIRYLNR